VNSRELYRIVSGGGFCRSRVVSHIVSSCCEWAVHE